MDDDVFRRLEHIERSQQELKTADNELTKAVTELTLTVRLMAQTVEALTKATDQNSEIDKRLIKVESAYGALKLIGGGATLSIMGLAITAIFGAK